MKTDNANLVPQEVFDFNAQEINRIYLKQIEEGSDSLTEIENNYIEALATMCPLTGGNAVYRARVLYGIINPDVHLDDIVICNSQGVSRNEFSKLQKQLDLLQKLENRSLVNSKGVIVYPIPASDKINVDYSYSENENVTFTIYDLLGNKLKEHTLENGSMTNTIYLKGLSTGMYTYRCSSTLNKTFYGKFIIE